MFDREAILTAVDLPALADELLGPGRGPKRSPTWPCPNPDHLQTGRTPPVTVFTARNGEPRWHCHGCGNGGTAVDLVMQVRRVAIRDALQELADRAGIPPLPGPYRPGSRRRSNREAQRRQAAYLAPQPVPALEPYVAQCAQALWRPEGAAVRRWLTEARGLPEDVLRANRVGVDLGWRRQRRPDGVPKVRQAVVLPVLVRGEASYVQLRVLGARPGFPKYLNPHDTLAPNPRLGLYRPAQRYDIPIEPKELIVTEGIIDALSAAAGGYHAAAILGAGYPDAFTAQALARIARPLVIAFDPDPVGRAGAERLVQLLDVRHRNASVLQLREGDLNENLIRATEWPLELAGRVQHATHPRPPPSLARGIG
jgi:DNA primase